MASNPQDLFGLMDDPMAYQQALAEVLGGVRPGARPPDQRLLALANAVAGKTAPPTMPGTTPAVGGPVPVAPPAAKPAAPVTSVLPLSTTPKAPPAQAPVTPATRAEVLSALGGASLFTPEPPEPSERPTMPGGATGQRAAGNLALLSGDRGVLVPFGMAQIQQAQNPTDLRAETLKQGYLRLALQAEAEKRQGEQGARRLTFTEQQIEDARRFGAGNLSARWAAMEQEREMEESRAKRKEKSDIEAATVGLRKEFNALPEVKEFSNVASSFANLMNSVNDMSGPGAISTIFNTMKILDPGVSVMEGDVQLIRNSGGAAAKFANLYDSVLNGNPLPKEVRQDLLRQGRTAYFTRKKQVDALSQKFMDLAGQAGVDPDQVVFSRAPDINLEDPPPATTKSSTAPSQAGTAASTTRPPDGIRVVSVSGMKPGDLKKGMAEGETIRVKETREVFQKVNGKLKPVTAKE